MNRIDVEAAERRSVTSELIMSARAAEIFDVIADPSQHSSIDGSTTVQGQPQGPTRLDAEATFTMAMRQARWPYRSTNRVVEYVQDALIAWESTGTWRNRTIVGGQRWRWSLFPHSHGTLVQHSYIWGYARWPMITVWLPGYPARARHTLPRSLSQLCQLVDQKHPNR